MKESKRLNGLCRMLNFIDKQQGVPDIHALTLIQQEPFDKLLTAVHLEKKGALSGSFKVDVDKMIETPPKLIDHECLSNLPGPPKDQRLPAGGILPSQEFLFDVSPEYHVTALSGIIKPIIRTLIVIFLRFMMSFLYVDVKKMFLISSPCNQGG